MSFIFPILSGYWTRGLKPVKNGRPIVEVTPDLDWQQFNFRTECKKSDNIHSCYFPEPSHGVVGIRVCARQSKHCLSGAATPPPPEPKVFSGGGGSSLPRQPGNVSCTLLGQQRNLLLARSRSALCAGGNKCALACLATLPILPFHNPHTCCAAFKRLQRKSATLEPSTHQRIFFLKYKCRDCLRKVGGIKSPKFYSGV